MEQIQKEPRIFKADPKEVEESKRYKVLGWIALPARSGPQLKTVIDDTAVSTGDEIVVYDDHIEKKRGASVEEIYFKDIAGIVFTKSPSGKLLFFHISVGNNDTLIVGMENMDELLASITIHLPPSDIAQRVVGMTFNGKAIARNIALVLVVSIVLRLLFLWASNLK